MIEPQEAPCAGLVAVEGELRGAKILGNAGAATPRFES